MRNLKYIGYFDEHGSSINRNYVTAGANKLEYIAKAISASQNVDIISASEVLEPKFRFYRSEVKEITDKINLKLFFSWGGSNPMLRKLKRLWHPLMIFIYLLFKACKNEPVVVYHSLGYFGAIIWAKKIKKFKLILEVEEIYSDVADVHPYFRKLEYRMFDIADAYILSTELLNDKVNPSQKPSCIIYGTYQIEPQIAQKFNDGKIHIVYAGTFDSNKGGALTAISAAEHLSENYHLHICGFGSEKDIANIKKTIEDFAQRSNATISYEGLLKGKEYIKFIQSCHIGLSTQNPDAAFNETSFPSKILSYMANGLSVVSIRINAVEKSEISRYMTYYNVSSPKAIASAIIGADIGKDYRHVINILNFNFIDKINNLICNVIHK